MNPVSPEPNARLQNAEERSKNEIKSCNGHQIVKNSFTTGPCRSSCKVNETTQSQTRPDAKCQKMKSREHRSGLQLLSTGTPPHPSRSHWPKRTRHPTPPRRQLRNLGCQVRISGIFGRCTGMSYLRQGRLGHRSSFLVGGAKSLQNSVSKCLGKGLTKRTVR